MGEEVCASPCPRNDAVIAALVDLSQVIIIWHCSLAFLSLQNRMSPFLLKNNICSASKSANHPGRGPGVYSNSLLPTRRPRTFKPKLFDRCVPALVTLVLGCWLLDAQRHPARCPAGSAGCLAEYPGLLPSQRRNQTLIWPGSLGRCAHY